jgi:hypothetical protein
MENNIILKSFYCIVENFNITMEVFQIWNKSMEIPVSIKNSESKIYEVVAILKFLHYLLSLGGFST